MSSQRTRTRPFALSSLATLKMFVASPFSCPLLCVHDRACPVVRATLILHLTRLITRLFICQDEFSEDDLSAWKEKYDLIDAKLELGTFNAFLKEQEIDKDKIGKPTKLGAAKAWMTAEKNREVSMCVRCERTATV